MCNTNQALIGALEHYNQANLKSMPILTDLDKVNYTTAIQEYGLDVIWPTRGPRAWAFSTTISLLFKIQSS